MLHTVRGLLPSGSAFPVSTPLPRPEKARSSRSPSSSAPSARLRAARLRASPEGGSAPQEPPTDDGSLFRSRIPHDLLKQSLYAGSKLSEGETCDGSNLHVIPHLLLLPFECLVLMT